jgi:N-acetylglutamate synthase
MPDVDPAVVAALPTWVGRRVVVRHRLPDGSATDALGTLVRADDRHVVVHRDATGTDAVVALADVVLARTVPPRAVRRPGRDRR